MQARSFAEMLEQTLRRYQNRTIEAAQAIEELIGLAKKMREANARGEQLGLTEDELAFYDALGNQRQRRPSLGRRDPVQDSPRISRDRPQKRHHRLDAKRERAGEAARDG